MQLIFRIEAIIIVVASFGESALRKKRGDCECKDFAPDGNTSCIELAQLPDWCESERIKQSHFCQISCHRCTCRINPQNNLASPFHEEHSKISSYDFQFLPTSGNVNQNGQNKQLQNQTSYNINSFKKDKDLVQNEEYINEIFTILNLTEDKGDKYFQFFHNNDDKNYQFTSISTTFNQKTQNQQIEYQLFGKNQTQDGGFTYQYTKATENLGLIDSYDYRISNHTNQFQNYSIDFLQDYQRLKTPKNVNENGTSTNLQDIFNNSGLSASNTNRTEDRNDILDNNVKINMFKTSHTSNNPDSVNSEDDSSDCSNYDSCDTDTSSNSDCGFWCIFLFAFFNLPCIVVPLCYCCIKNKQAILDFMVQDNQTDDNNPDQSLSNNNNNNNLSTTLLDSQQSISTSSNQQQNSNSLSFQQIRQQILEQQNTSSNSRNIITRQQHQSGQGLFSQSNFYQSNEWYNVSDADHRSENQRYSQNQSRASSQAGTSTSTQRPAPGFSSIPRLLRSFPSANLQERQKQGDCGICLVELVEDFEAGDRAVVFPCFHVFHKNCAKKWIESKKGLAANCPLCQTNLKQGRQESILYP